MRRVKPHEQPALARGQPRRGHGRRLGAAARWRQHGRIGRLGRLRLERRSEREAHRRRGEPARGLERARLGLGEGREDESAVAPGLARGEQTRPRLLGGGEDIHRQRVQQRAHLAVPPERIAQLRLRGLEEAVSLVRRAELGLQECERRARIELDARCFTPAVTPAVGHVLERPQTAGRAVEDFEDGPTDSMLRGRRLLDDERLLEHEHTPAARLRRVEVELDVVVDVDDGAALAQWHARPFPSASEEAPIGRVEERGRDAVRDARARIVGLARHALGHAQRAHAAKRQPIRHSVALGRRSP